MKAWNSLVGICVLILGLVEVAFGILIFLRSSEALHSYTNKLSFGFLSEILVSLFVPAVGFVSVWLGYSVAFRVVPRKYFTLACALLALHLVVIVLVLLSASGLRMSY